MASRAVTLMELWQTCRTCEDSCRRMADVFGELVRQAGGDPPVLPVTVDVGSPDIMRIGEPDPPCIPPGPCVHTFSTLADKVELLALRVAVLVEATRALREQNTPREIHFYTCVPGGPGQPSP